MDMLYNLIWKINPRMQSEIEREEVILYPHVLEKLKTAGIRYNFGHRREKIS
jgi:L-rhamnose mutarotase